MPTFYRKDSKFLGIKFDGDNKAAIVEFLGLQREDQKYCELWKNTETSESALYINVPHINLGRIKPEEWILVSNDKSTYFVFDEKKLQLLFEGV